MRIGQSIATRDNRMSDVPVGWEPSRDRPINTEYLRAALAEIEASSEELANDEP